MTNLKKEKKSVNGRWKIFILLFNLYTLKNIVNLIKE